MKTAIAIAGLVLMTSMVSMGKPPGKGNMFKAIGTAEEIESAGPDATLMMVCTSCKTVREIDAASSKELARKFREGGAMHCDSCKKDFKVVSHGPPGKQHSHMRAVIVGDDGEECMFVVKKALDQETEAQ